MILLLLTKTRSEYIIFFAGVTYDFISENSDHLLNTRDMNMKHLRILILISVLLFTFLHMTACTNLPTPTAQDLLYYQITPAAYSISYEKGNFSAEAEIIIASPGEIKLTYLAPETLCGLAVSISAESTKIILGDTVIPITPSDEYDAATIASMFSLESDKLLSLEADADSGICRAIFACGEENAIVTYSSADGRVCQINLKSIILKFNN